MKLWLQKRNRWGSILIIATGAMIASQIVTLLLTSLTEWAWLLSCWVGLLLLGVVYLALVGFARNAPSPSLAGFWEGAPWAAVGGTLGFGGMWVNWLFSNRQQDDGFLFGCFGPLVGLGLFAIAGLMQYSFFFALISSAMIMIAAALSSRIGETAALVIMGMTLAGVLITGLYTRLKWDVPGELSGVPQSPTHRFVQTQLPILLLILMGIAAVFLWWYAH
jgi:hypothetical protein